MMRNLFVTFVFSFLMGIAAINAGAQPTGLTYQGSLTDGANPANGMYDLEFSLFDALTAGNKLGTTQTRNGVSVTNGIFSVSLDYGPQFPGANRFLEIRVRQTGGGAFTLLVPRQTVNSTPYSIKSINAETAAAATNAAQLGGIASSQYLQTNGNGSALTNLNAGSITTGTLSNARLGVVPIANGGTGSASQNFVDLANNQSIGGHKSFLDAVTGNIVNSTSYYEILGKRVLKSTGSSNSGNLFAGVDAGGFDEDDAGTGNSFVGVGAGLSNATGINNAFFGRNAGAAMLSGNSNTLLGAFTTVATNPTNSTAIGANAFVNQSNSLVLGSINGINGATANTNVGIGTPSPDGLLEAVSASDSRVFFSHYSNQSGSSIHLHGRKARGSEFSASAVLMGDDLFEIGAIGHSGTDFTSPSATIKFRASENFTSTAAGTNMIFSTVANGTLNLTPRLVIDGEGQLGVGTSFPLAPFHVRGNSSSVSNPIAIIESATGSQVPLVFRQLAADVARIRADSEGSLVFATLVGTDRDIYFRAGDDSGTDMFIQSSSGNVAIGNTNPADKLEVVGNIRVGTGTTGCVLDNDGTVIAGVCSSDERLKDSITDFPATLERLTQLRPVHFYWRTKEYPARKFGEGQSFGLIAQEVEQVMPELVTEDESGMKAVRYNKLPMLMLQAIKELKDENDSLKRSMQAMSQKQNEELARQRSEIDELKQVVCAFRSDTAVCRTIK